MSRKKITANNREELGNIASFLDSNWLLLQKIPLQELLFKESGEGRFVSLAIDWVHNLRAEREDSADHTRVYWHLQTPVKLNFHGTEHREMSDELAVSFLATLRYHLLLVVCQLEKKQREEDEKSAFKSIVDQISQGKARNYNFS